MNRITILSRNMFDFMLNYARITDFNVERTNVGYICINDPEAFSFFNQLHPNVINLNFDDITLEDYESFDKNLKSYMKLFTDDMANKIKEFVDLNKDKKEWIIHCVAGISRSGAIGLWLTKYLGYNLFEFLENNPYIHPNMFVYNKMMDISLKD